MNPKIKLSSAKWLGRPTASLQKNAPHILTGIGAAGVVATGVLAARAAYRRHDDIKTVVGIVKLEKDASRDEVKEEMKEECKRIAEDFVPVVVVAGLSVASILYGHGIMVKRNAGLVAAYTALDGAYKAYRARVQEKLGEDEERKLYSEPRLIKTVNEDGEACEIIDITQAMPSPYSRFFDEYSTQWNKNPEYNRMFLHTQESYANDLLRTRGHLFLNEVYDMLGLARTQFGQTVGWYWDPSVDHLGGDGFVSFGYYDIADENARAFVNCIEGTVLLDFNVDGIIQI